MGLLRDSPGQSGSINLAFPDPLGFLVRFVQTDLDKQTPGEWMDLRWEVKEFTDDATVSRADTRVLRGPGFGGLPGH